MPGLSDPIPAYVIHSRPYRNSSLMLTCLTQSYGRVVVAARSARGPKSRFRGQLQSFIPLLMQWREGRDIYSLSHLELRREPQLLFGSALLCAFYVNELLWHLTLAGSASDELFFHYEKVLSDLSTRTDYERVLRLYEKQLLIDLGYGISWTHTAPHHEPIMPDQLYTFECQFGFSKLEKPSGRCYLGRSLLAMASNEIKDCDLLAMKHLMRRQIAFYLGNKAIHTRDFF